MSGYPRSRFSSLFLPRYFILLQLLFSVIFSHIIFRFWFCCCLLFYFWLCFFILEPLRYFSVLFSHIFLVFSWFWFHFATINFLSWFFYWSHHLIIVFDFAFICSHIYFIVVLFSSVFLVSLFFQAVFMISFLTVIFFTCYSFVHCAFCSSGFLFAFHLSVLSTGSIFIRQVILFGCKLWYWCWIVCCIIQYFCCFWSWSIFCILSLSLLQSYNYNTTLHDTDTTFLIQPT